MLTIRDLDLFVPVFVAAFFFLTWYNGPLTLGDLRRGPGQRQHDRGRSVPLFIHLAGDAVSFPLVGFLSDQFGIGKAVLILPVMSLVGAVIVLGAVRTVGRDMARVSAA